MDENAYMSATHLTVGKRCNRSSVDFKFPTRFFAFICRVVPLLRPCWARPIAFVEGFVRCDVFRAHWVLGAPTCSKRRPSPP
jgi:hypothetical protein